MNTSFLPAWVAPLKPFVKNESIVAFAPGRVNLIGEHTDYNNGFVLPGAMDKRIYMVLTPRIDKTIAIRSLNMEDDVFTTSCKELESVNKPFWVNYILGVIYQFKKKGISIYKGFDITCYSNLPVGASVSSSAALECVTALCLNEFYKTNFDKLTLAKISQKAEHEHAGVHCGILDQFASIYGLENHVIKLDCQSMEYEYVPFNTDEVSIVLFDTGIKHSLASSEYNVRRKQCETGVAMIQPYCREVKSLRDVTIEMCIKYILPFDITVYRRCRYVQEEIQRLLLACEDLKKNDLLSFGKRMVETHYGLSHLYQVSCTELDFLVTSILDLPNVYGGRMMGGGFGGCTINLVKKNAVDETIAKLTHLYKTVINKDLKAYVTDIKEGAKVVKGSIDIAIVNKKDVNFSSCLSEVSHRRYNILTGEWILVLPHRSKRSWQGKTETINKANVSHYDKDCYLCPGNIRSNGEHNVNYQSIFVFNNDFAALLEGIHDAENNINVNNILQAKSERGICKVVCFSPQHDKTLASIEEESIKKLIDTWQTEYIELSKKEWVQCISIFENKGDIMGCSNLHPHGQIWAQEHIPNEIVKETNQQKLYYEKNKNSLLSDYLKIELEEKIRVVCKNKHFVALVPFWAIWPYEVIVISIRHFQNIAQMTEEEKISFANILKIITCKYDRLFNTSFPYSACMHQAPINDDEVHTEWHWHYYFYPPLLRSANIKKFMVGYEMLAEAQRDITPEQAATMLQSI